jgi:hypothetical protein
MYPNVLFERKEKLYKCLYYTRIKEWGSKVTPGSLAGRFVRLRFELRKARIYSFAFGK